MKAHLAVATVAGLLAQLLTAQPARADAELVTISSGELAVHVDPDFPRVAGYTWTADGSVLPGQTQDIGQVVVNGTAYTPKSRGVRYGDAVDYTLDVAELGLSIEASLKVKGHELEFAVTKIDEGQTELRTLAIPDQGLVAVGSDQPGARLSEARLPMTTAYEHEDDFDRYAAVADLPVDPAPRGTTYAILNTDRLAASLETNSLSDQSRLLVRTTEKGGVKTTAVSSGEWTWRPQPADGYQARPADLPNTKVVLTSDRNRDGVVDWQDGAIAHREIMHVPLGAERTKDYVVSNIEYNTNSFASHPFLRVLDDVKKGSNLTDGLGQLVQLKGYQAEGHDNAHPDYGGHINAGAGGKDDLNVLVKQAKKYGAAIGVHINSTEAYPDATSFRWDMTNGPTDTGWIYRDISYHINRDKDVQSGALKKRLDQLKADVPDLSFIYNDVYFGRGYNAYELARIQRENGWMLHTEFEEFLDRDTLWYHRSGQYAKNGIRSRLIRFIQNHQRDVWYRDDATLLKGLSNLSYGGWQGQTDLAAWQRKIFTNNLPTKYMQHFEIVKWTDHRVDFEDGVYSTDATGVWQLFKNDVKLAEGDTVFLPWDPDKETKIYHWNDAGGTTTWTLPERWRSLPSVTLYRLTGTGRTAPVTLPVTDGKVTVRAEAKQPYVLYPEPVEPGHTDWGQRALVDDGSFNSGTLDAWQADGQAASVKTSERGWQYAHFDGAGRITQVVKGLKPGTYSASAYVRVTGRAPATIGVAEYGVKQTTDVSPALLKDPVNVWGNTTFQKMWVTFTVPEGQRKATISLEAGAGGVDFADVRMNPTKVSERAADHYFYEDFEAADRAWGPFVNSEGSGVDNPHSHRAERHEGYTRDVIDGDYSFKSFQIPAGDVWRTIPQTITFRPNRIYRIGLDYQDDRSGQYRMQVRTESPAATLVDDPMPATTDRRLDSWPAATDPKPDGWNDSYPPQQSAPSREYATIFTTGGRECGDPYLALTSTGGNGAITVDNLVVDDLGPAPASGACPATGVGTVELSPFAAEPGHTAKLTATFTNHGVAPATSARIELTGPDGWRLTRTSPAEPVTVEPGRTLIATYDLAVPADVKPGGYAVHAQASSTYLGKSTTAAARQAVTFACRTGIRCEAEDAAYRGAAIETLPRGFSGDGYINLDSGTGNYVEWTADRLEPGTYTLAVHYALISGNRPLALSVNGTTVATYPFPVTGSWSTWTDFTTKVQLGAGANKIRLTTAASDGPNLDYLTLTRDG